VHFSADRHWARTLSWATGDQASNHDFERRSAGHRRRGTMYAAIRQGKAKAGMAEELARRIKEGAIPIISDVPGFQAY